MTTTGARELLAKIEQYGYALCQVGQLVGQGQAAGSGSPRAYAKETFDEIRHDVYAMTGAKQ